MEAAWKCQRRLQVSRELKEEYFLPLGLGPKIAPGDDQPSTCVVCWDILSGTATAVSTLESSPIKVERVRISSATKNGLSYTLWSFGNKGMSL